MREHLAAQLVMLRSQAQANLYNFMKIDVTTCNLGVDMALLYAKRLNVRESGREIVLVNAGVRTIERLLPSLDSVEQKRKIASALDQVKDNCAVWKGFYARPGKKAVTIQYNGKTLARDPVWTSTQRELRIATWPAG